MADENINVKNVITSKIKHFISGYFIPEFKQIFSGTGNAFGMFLKPSSLFNKGFANFPYFITVIALLVFGLSIHYSASYSNIEQVVFSVIGLIMMLAFSRIKLEFFRQLAVPFAAVSIILLFAVLFTSPYQGTKRWLFHFQPSELGKIAFIIFMAYLIDKYKSKRHKTESFFVFLCITGVFSVLVLLESHLSGFILFALIGVSMMWFGDLSKKWFMIYSVVSIKRANKNKKL